MSLFGKILAVLNILGAAGFVCVAALDYGKRQTWAQAVYKHDLFIHGIPVDEEQLNHEGRKLTEYLGPETQKELFAGRAVTTQTAEAQSLYQTLKGKIGSATEVPQQINLYSRVLLPLAGTNRDRERLLSYLTYTSDVKDAKGKAIKGIDYVKAVLGAAYKEAARWAALPEGKTLNDALLRAVFTKMQDDMKKGMKEAKAEDRKKAEDKSFDEALEETRKALEASRDPGKEKRFDRIFRELVEMMGRTPGDPFGGVSVEPFATALLAALAADPKKPFDKVFADSLAAQRDQLAEQFEEEFRPALAAGPSGPQARTVRRRAIAHLLLNLIHVLPEETAAGATPPASLFQDPDFKRALNVVGLEAAIAETNDQAQVLHRIASELALERERDRNRFVSVHEALVEQIRDRAAQLATEESVLARKTKQRDEQKDLVAKSKDTYVGYAKELAASQKLTAERLAELRDMSDRLYKSRVELRNALDGNQKLEKEIRGLEVGR